MKRRVDAKTLIASAALLLLVVSILMPLLSNSASAMTHRDGKVEAVPASGIPVVQWSNPEHKPKAVIVALHGATQQAGSFDVLAKHLAAQDFAIVGLDLRGHGRWYFGPFQKLGGKTIDYNQSVKDLQALAGELRKQYPNVPLFCIGESTGAGVAMHAASEEPNLFDGLVIASAGTRPNIFNLKMIIPDVCKGLSNLNKQIDGSQYILKYASEDQRIVNEMVADPLSRSFLSGKEILKTLFFINTMQSVSRKMPEHLPVLLLQGGKDHIVSPATAEALMRNLRSDDKRMVVFPDSGHVILGTSFIKEPVKELVTKWLNDETNAVTVKVEMARNPIAPTHVDSPHKALVPATMINQPVAAAVLR